MFDRNEKYGQALHLQYGANPSGSAGASGPNQHFGVSSFLTSLFGCGGAIDKADIVEINLETGLSKKVATRDRTVKAHAANENQTNQASRNAAF